MLLKQFKRTGPLTVFLIILVLFFLWSGPVIRVKGSFGLYFDMDPMPLYGLISEIIGTHPIPGIIASFLLVSLMSFLMVNLNTTLFFIHERTFLPALFYILLSGLFPQYQLMNPAIYGAVFLMLAIRRVMESYRVQGIAYNFFDAGLLIGTGSLFYANLIWFAVVIFAGIMLLRAVNTREILLSVLGLLTPFVLIFGFYYVAGKDLIALKNIFFYNLFGRHAEFAFIPVIITALIYSGFLLFASISHLFLMVGSMKVQARKTFWLMLWVFMTAVIIWFLVPSVSIEIIWIGAIPVSYFLSHYFVFMKRKRLLPEILFGLFFLMIIMMQIWYFR